MKLERDELANFRYGLIAPVVSRQLEKGERQKLLLELANQTVITPQGECKKSSIRTLERYIAAYQSQGLAGLAPKQRQDAACCRAIDPDLLTKAVALKLEAPSRSVQQNSFSRKMY